MAEYHSQGVAQGRHEGHAKNTRTGCRTNRCVSVPLPPVRAVAGALWCSLRACEPVQHAHAPAGETSGKFGHHLEPDGCNVAYAIIVAHNPISSHIVRSVERFVYGRNTPKHPEANLIHDR